MIGGIDLVFMGVALLLVSAVLLFSCLAAIGLGMIYSGLKDHDPAAIVFGVVMTPLAIGLILIILGQMFAGVA